MWGRDPTLFPALKVLVIFILSREVGKASPPGWQAGLPLPWGAFLGGVAMETDGVWSAFLAGETAVLIMPEQPI